MAALGPCSTRGDGRGGLAESSEVLLSSGECLEYGDIHWLHSSSALLVASSTGKALAVVLKDSSETGDEEGLLTKTSPAFASVLNVASKNPE